MNAALQNASTPGGDLTQPDQADSEFLLAHYQQLFDRNEKSQQTRWQFVQLSLVAFATFYAAILGDKLIPDGLAKILVGVLPIGLAKLGQVHAKSLRSGMIERGEIMRSIERKFNVFGWQVSRKRKRELGIEAYVKSHPSVDRATAELRVRHTSDGQYAVARKYWTIAIVVTVAAEVYFLITWLAPDIT